MVSFEKEIGAVAQILTDAFFSENTNFFTYQREKLKTYLSLESSIPKKHEKELYVCLVACRNEDGKVLGFAEIDCRQSKKENLPPRPYMCNLAVDKKWRRQGIASSLVKSCEKIAMKNKHEAIYLKVRSKNKEAVSMYESLGYSVVSCETNQIEGSKICELFLMQKKITKEGEKQQCVSKIDTDHFV